jgi:hypothetical protein
MYLLAMARGAKIMDAIEAEYSDAEGLRILEAIGGLPPPAPDPEAIRTVLLAGVEKFRRLGGMRRETPEPEPPIDINEDCRIQRMVDAVRGDE